jgi:mRNA-degrading endonuclease toxin of MazEF toxin-antitoxin module
MPLPEPEPGLVISYSYLWHYERNSGVEEGRKDRPCVILVAVERQQDGDTVVVALPVTHRPPEDAAVTVEIPQAVKQQLGLDLERSWVVVQQF